MKKYTKPLENIVKMNMNINLKYKTNNFKKSLENYKKKMVKTNINEINSNKTNIKNTDNNYLKSEVKESEFIYYMKKYFKK